MAVTTLTPAIARLRLQGIASLPSFQEFYTYVRFQPLRLSLPLNRANHQTNAQHESPSSTHTPRDHELDVRKRTGARFRYRS